jgi:cephalosporin hydroxylase
MNEHLINQIIQIKSLALLSTEDIERALPNFGMNDEAVHEMPQELKEHFGKGIRFWQYPNQLSKLIKYVSDKKVNSYLEIGVRWGGTFIIMNEVLKRLNPNLISYACDIVGMSNILTEYKSISPFTYLWQDSRQQEFLDNFNHVVDMVFIDGDHTYQGIRDDYLTAVLLGARYIIFHDISSDQVPEVKEFWDKIKQDYTYYEFVDQYDSVDGTFLGIGIIERTPE